MFGNIDFEYSCSPTLGTGTGNIISDPMFVNHTGNNYNLTENSPCIDAGDPSSPLDPDNTINDIGCLYYDQRLLNVTLTPFGMPITVPANGGSFEFNIAVSNNENTPETFDIWTMVTLPNGAEYGPVINFPGFTAPAGFNGSRDRLQSVPSSAPTGNYIYDAYIGTYPDVIISEDHFDFAKSNTDDGGNFGFEWTDSGESFDELTTSSETHHSSFIIHHSVSPNPFNPVTNISLELAQRGYVQMVVYDITGREIVKLMDGLTSAGSHEIVFDASNLPTGIYFLNTITENSNSTKKLLLLK